VTAFVLAREYRWPALTLAGSLLVLGGIGYALFWHLPELSRPRLVLAALLGHATFALLTGLGVRRARLSDGDRLFSRPLLATALFSSACALPALLTALAAGPLLPLALAAGCLAAVWGVLAWDERQPVLFAGAQAVLGLGAALAALVRVEQQPWFPGLADGLYDPRAYLMVG